MDSRRHRVRGLPVLMLLAAMAGHADGTKVYRHVDANGVVTFSDAPPSGGVEADIVEIDTPAAQDPNTYLNNLQAMRETTDRMAADRREREKHRAELREINARTQAYEQPQVVEYQDYSNYWPVYRRPVYPRPPWRPGYRPRPEPPIARPPYRPGHPGIIEGPNSQLMRPIVSSR